MQTSFHLAIVGICVYCNWIVSISYIISQCVVANTNLTMVYESLGILIINSYSFCGSWTIISTLVHRWMRVISVWSRLGRHFSFPPAGYTLYSLPQTLLYSGETSYTVTPLSSSCGEFYVKYASQLISNVYLHVWEMVCMHVQ